MATVITTVGRSWIADRLANGVATSQNRIGWGTGAGTAVVGDTTLFTEASEARASAAISSPAAFVFQAVGILTCLGAVKTIKNSGVFDAATGGVMMLKSDHADVVLSIGDSIGYTFQLSILV